MTLAEGLLRPIGKVIGTHGLRGELKVRTHLEDAAALLAARKIVVRGKDGKVSVHVPARSGRHKGYLLLSLQGLQDLTAVEPLVGGDLLVDSRDVPRPSGEIFRFELLGLTVVDRQRGELGALIDLFRTAAHGIYVVDGPYGEIMIPVVAQFVTEVDLAGGRILVDVPEGLYPDQS